MMDMVLFTGDFKEPVLENKLMIKTDPGSL